MIKSLLTATVMTAASFAIVGSAQAAGAAAMGADGTGQFYATPIQKGAPTDLPGERMIPGATLAAQAIDVVVAPTLVPISQIGTTVGATVGSVVDPGGAAPAAAAAPMMRMHRHHHMMHRHHMMSRKMMMKKKMMMMK